MARIVHMDQIVPPDIEFHMGDEAKTVYVVEGGVLLESMLRMGRLEGELGRGQAEIEELAAADASEADLDAANERMISTLTQLNAEILKVLQVRQPELTECPFSAFQVGIFLASLRGELDDIVGPDPTPAPATAPKTRTPNRASRRASARSSG